jgi:hypothetical protein
MFSATGLASGSHTMALQATGSQRAASRGPFIVVDAFEVRWDGKGGRARRDQPGVFPVSTRFPALSQPWIPDGMMKFSWYPSSAALRAALWQACQSSFMQ